MNIIILILGIIGAYLLGSFSSAVIVCRLLRLPDPRREGSKNPGTTNVLRLGGRWAAALTLLGDILKGWLPVYLIKFYTINPWIISAVLFAAVLGHLYPLFFHFKGGKGVATALGALFALSPALGAITVFTWIGVFALTRYSSLSALIAFASMPCWAWGFLDERYAPGLIGLTVLIFWRHRENIQRLIAGTEGKSQLKQSGK